MMSATEQPDRGGDLRRSPSAQPQEEVAGKRQRGELWEREVRLPSAQSCFQQAITQRLQRGQEGIREAVGINQTGGGLGMGLSEYRLTRSELKLISRNRLHLLERAILEPAKLLAEIESSASRKHNPSEERDPFKACRVTEWWLIGPQHQTIDVVLVQANRYRVVIRQAEHVTAASGPPPGYQAASNHALPAGIVFYFIASQRC